MPILIAEVKTRSPFDWQSDKSWSELFDIANTIGDWLSIHTDPRWGGSFELLSDARKRTDKPILAKGIHANDDDIVQAIAAGADYVLVVGRVPKIHLDRCLIEPNTIAELRALPKNTKAVWNARDLRDGSPKLETFDEARNVFDGWLCQASYIKKPEDVDHRANAALIGTNLAAFAESL